MDIQERSLRFGVKLLKFVERFPNSISANIILKQLIKSGTSIGANMEEADGASSKKDFINKVAIARKEARETRYWLILTKKIELLKNQQNTVDLEVLIEESYELMRILSAIINKARDGQE